MKRIVRHDAFRALAAVLVLGSLTASCAVIRRDPEATARERLEQDLEKFRQNAMTAEQRVSQNGSLWLPGGPMILGTDTKAFRDGDLLTIAIVEGTRGSQQAQTDLTKSSKVDLDVPKLFGYEVKIAGKHPDFDPTNSFETSTQKQFAGDGETSRETTIIATLTARVIGVYPNGNLAVLGHKEVKVNHERQMLSLAGIVRTEDIRSDNTVLSDKLAELSVHLGGLGDINDTQREGWLLRFLQKVWPF